VPCLEFRATTARNDHDGDGVRTTRVWRRVLGVEHTVIESVDLESDGRGGEVLIARVRPKGGVGLRCSRCRRRCSGYDVSKQPRRWRGLDLGTTPVFLQATTRRVSCPEHGVVVAAVPWARPGSRFTTAFEDTAAWLVCHATLSVVAVLLRIAWRSVSGIITRVVAERAGATDRLAGLRRIGIDEISYKKGQRYLLVVTCHDTGRLVWAGKDRTKQTLGRFFDDLGTERTALLTHVSADGAEFIHAVVAERAPRAVLCLDPFHVVAWATKAHGRGPPRAGRRAAPRWARRRSLNDQGHPLGVAEEPAQAQRRAAHHAGRDPGHQRPALPRLPAERATPGGVPSP
jgi:transposase